MPLIAMTLEMGSLSSDVAQGVAKALGQEVIHHEIIDHLADKMRVRKSHVIRFLNKKATIFDRLSADRTSLSIYTADKILDMAQQNGGAVIHGWGAAQLLRPVGHAVCVRVCAPRKLRVKRMMQQLNTQDEELVSREVDFSDEAHGAIIRRHFRINWQDVEHYDLALNTERVPVPECIEEILSLLRKPAFEETPQSRATLANLSLAAHVRAALRTDPRTRKVDVSIESDAGHVKLSGIVLDDMDLDALTEVAAKVPGVNEVQNLVRQETAPVN
jgi:cytidylate kinase